MPSDKDITDAIVKRAMGRIRDRKPAPTPKTTILDEGAVSEILDRLSDCDTSVTMRSACGEYNCECHYDVPALIATVKHLRERERTIAAVNADWLEERQQTIDLAESLQSQLEQLRAENERLSSQFKDWQEEKDTKAGYL